MATLTKTRSLRKPAVKPERHVRMGPVIDNGFAMSLRIGTGESAKLYGYYVNRIPADFGIAFHVEKFNIDRVEGEPSEYDVLIDTERGHHSCSCPGNTFHGHCKHIESILALAHSGKIELSI